MFEAIRSGANGFLVKDTEPAELLRAVRAVVAGDALLSPRITRRLIEEFASRAKDPAALPDLARLTDREREVVALVAEGLTNDEIAGRLVMSGATAKTHVSRAMIKVGARDRAQLVVFAYETGLVRPGWQPLTTPGGVVGRPPPAGRRTKAIPRRWGHETIGHPPLCPSPD